MLNLLKPERGIGLVEYLTSIGLVSIITLFVVGLLMQSTHMSKAVDARYAMTNIAQQQIDTLKALSFTEIISAEESDVPVDANGDYAPDGSYVRSTDIIPNFNGVADLHLIRVNVKRASRTATPGTRGGITLVTLISDLQ